jgi:hypothetical protein
MERKEMADLIRRTNGTTIRICKPKEEPCQRKLEIVLPIPMPTWNRILAMHPWQRMELRHLIHLFVGYSNWGWSETMEYKGKVCETRVLMLEYMQLIRPNAKRKKELKELKNAVPSVRRRKGD